MKRIKVLIGKRRVMVIATLAILVLAAAALVASSASFSASTTKANVNNMFTTGNLTLTEGTNPGLTFDPGLYMPGKAHAGTVTFDVTSNGGTSSLYLKQTTNLTANVLAPRLDLVVKNGANTVYSGTVGAADIAAGVKLTGITVPNSSTATPYTFTFSVTLHDSDDHTLANAGADNAYRNINCTPTFVFTAVSD
jgi:hypothetical protein